MILLNFEDLINSVVSYMFKNGNGLSLIQKLIEQNKDYAFVFLSSDNTIERVIEAMHVGAVDFVSKTYQLEENFEPVIKRAYNNQLLKIQKNELEKAIEIKNKELSTFYCCFETIIIVFIYSKYLNLMGQSLILDFPSYTKMNLLKNSDYNI
jgi:YesN/AraC family two-component response regulator